MYLNKKRFIIYWSVILKCSLVISLYLSDFAELIHCPWKMFSFFFPSLLVLLEAEGDNKQGHYLYFPAAAVCGLCVYLLCCTWGTPERGAEGRIGVEGELFYVS